MSLIDHAGRRARLTRTADAEVLRAGASRMMLLADADQTGGAVNVGRTILPAGVDGPPPHYHAESAEMFFVLDGALRALAGDCVLGLDKGDFLLVPRGMPHAFVAPPDTQADVLIVFAPAIGERFEYFRLADRVLRGEAEPQEILASQMRFDNHFVDSPQWASSRIAAGSPAGPASGAVAAGPEIATSAP